MIEVEEQGRRLRVLVGGEVEVLVAPVSGDTGAALLSGFLGLTFDLLSGQAAEQVEADLLELSVGVDNVDLVHSLRPSEIYDVTMAAFFWQTAGGIEATRAYVGGDHPKAMDLLTEKSGLEALLKLRSGESENPTRPPAVSPATGTHPSTEPGSSAVEKLPMNRRSIRQNATPA